MADEGIDSVPAGHGEKKVDETTYKTVADAFYRKKIEAPKAARANSQNAYTIAAAVAAAVVAAGAFADIAAEPSGIRIVGIAALALWLLTAGLFMYAVAAPYEAIGKGVVTSELDFVTEALKRAKSETDEIDRRQFYARISALIASMLTVTALALALFLPSPSTARGVTVRISHGDQERLSELCGQQVPTVVSGTTDTESLEDGTIPFDPTEEECKTPGTTTLQEKQTVFILDP